ncbi:MAG: hypothetical protein K6C97_03530 [Treponema sp.]|nr:hypothetical protein [Treponema sp.]
MLEKPGWTYSYIEILGQHIAVNDKTDVLYTEDKTMYTPEESRLLKKRNYQLPKLVHQVKKLFQGTLVQ